MVCGIDILCSIYLEHSACKVCRLIVEILIKSGQHFPILMDDKFTLCRMVLIGHLDDGIFAHAIHLICGIGIHFDFYIACI